MKPFGKLSHKFLFLWGISIAASLALVWGFFTVSLERYHEQVAMDSLKLSFEKVSVQLQRRDETLRDIAGSVVQGKALISITNLLSRYQDIRNYDSLIFDVEKRELAARLGTLQGIGDHHYMAIYDAKRNLATFHLHDGAEYNKIGIASYNDGRPVLLTANFGERDYSPLERLPNTLLEHYAEKIPDRTQAYFHSLNGELHYITATPIIRKRLGGEDRVVGVLVLADILSGQFLTDMANLTGNKVALFKPVFADPDAAKDKAFAEHGRLPDLFKTPGAYLNIPMQRYFAGGASIAGREGGVAAPFFIGIDKKQLLSGIETFGQSVLWAFLVFAVILFPIGAFAIRRMITRPISALMQGVEAMARRDFKGLREFQSDDELGLLARSFNDMAHTIEVREKDLKKAEEQARESQARFSEILDIAPEAIVVIDSAMKIAIFNKGAERTFGYRADEILGKSFEVLIPERFRPTHQAHVDGFDKSSDTYRPMDKREEVSGWRKDGTEFPATASVSKLQYGNEKIFTVILHDVTERKKAQDDLLAAKGEAEQANRAKSDFLASISHELRTPLNAILGFAEILKHQYLGPMDLDKYSEYAADIHSSGEHLLSLVNDLLDISTIEAGRQSLFKENLGVGEVVQESIGIVAQKAKDKDIKLTTQLTGTGAPLLADRRAVRQILLNLLSNAIKFTPDGGDVTVTAEALPEHTVFEIADTGRGIPEDQLKDLTNPFTRIEQEPYQAVEGWGLGLAITKSLIELHDGHLNIQSQLGHGTTVTVTLPNLAA